MIQSYHTHRRPLPHHYLPLRSRCSHCSHELSGKRTLDPDTVPQDVKALDQMPVGAYGVQLLWSDAHYTGIYTYEVLRAACPCIICGEARASAKNANGGSSESPNA